MLQSQWAIAAYLIHRHPKSCTTLERVTQKGYIPVKMISLLPDAIRVWRKERELSQTKLAEKAGISRATVSRMELGESGSTTFDTLNSLARALGVDADKLVTFDRPTK